MSELHLRLRWTDITNLPFRIALFAFDLYYQLAQIFIILLFKPRPPADGDAPLKNPFGRIAIIGAGLTGVSSAAHCIAHNFEVTLYDKNSSVGGIWSHVNSTSGLQINSLIYRFHPAVFYKEGFPKRDEILSEIARIWQEYGLNSRTKFNSEVVKVERMKGTGLQFNDNKKTSPRSQWLIYTSGNNKPDGPFDAVICSIGTCGEPMKIEFNGMSSFIDSGRRFVHSSELDQLGASEGDDEDSEKVEKKHKNMGQNSIKGGKIHSAVEAQPVPGVSYSDAAKIDPCSSVSISDLAEAYDGKGQLLQQQNFQNGDSMESTEDREKSRPLDVHGKTVVVIGSGASGVEAAQWAFEKGAGIIYLLARDDKWIIPCNVVIDTMLSMQPFGREMPLSFIPETLIRWFHYRDLAGSVAPQGKPLFEGTPIINDVILEHIRSGRIRYVRCDTERFTSKGVVIKHHEDGSKEEVPADLAILATGFKRPDIDFLPEDLFPKSYERPNLYLQTFSTEDWSVLLTNSAFQGAFGTVGHFHIGIYTRILLTFLLDEKARPRSDDMKLWVDVLRFVKRGAPGGALGFFTYMELTIWFLLFHLFRLDRLKWMFFIMQGWGVTGRES